MLERLKDRGIENVLALRGDVPEGMDRAHADYHYAGELVKEIRDFGGFCIGGACYPESHPESPSGEADLDRAEGEGEDVAEVPQNGVQRGNHRCDGEIAGGGTGAFGHKNTSILGLERVCHRAAAKGPSPE
jgi:hypothetical protein